MELCFDPTVVLFDRELNGTVVRHEADLER